MRYRNRIRLRVKWLAKQFSKRHGLIDSMIRKRIRANGIVQGVGFRPYVWTRATANGLAGWVCNDLSGVTLEIQGTSDQVEAFLARFQESAPPLARIDSLTVMHVAVAPETGPETRSETGFSILESCGESHHSTPISPDISVCDACMRELLDRSDRRHGYPFINCTNCGPRFTIIQDLPYDRPLTTMKSFPMCDDCQREYDDPADRRFHAQPNACPACGPTVWFVSDPADEQRFHGRPKPSPAAGSAIEDFRNAIKQGQIVAVKGIGGFHLACDAMNEEAIRRLRQRKGRVDKPFSMMFRDVEQAQTFAVVSDQERDLLHSKERPIVLLSKKIDAVAAAQAVCNAAAPGNNFVGAMLPYSPMHYLLMDESPLILTSANISDEPTVRTNHDARERLATLCDSFLLHDREINLICDDSVVRCVDGQVVPIRRSRGYAPMPVCLERGGPSVLAVGGEIKTTFCVTKDNYAYMSQHIGDMGDLETLRAMQRSVEHFLRLFRIDPEVVCADLHPDYLSGQWATELVGAIGVPLVLVQHHFAHVVSLIAEHRCSTDRKIIGCCFDGTGFGTDGAMWGGEFLMANGFAFDRYAQLKYAPLPGGDASVRRPYRVALSQLWANGIDWSENLPCVAACPVAERTLLHQQLQNNLNCVPTSSMGRLFDAVASLIGVRHQISYEAQAAMEMEAMAESVVNEVDPQAYSFKIQHASLLEIDCADLLQQICADVESGVGQPRIAAQFHHAVANMATDVCQSARAESELNVVGLTGGVFQNALLLTLTRDRLIESGFSVLTHSIVPPNDGGIALGQAVVARNQLQAKPKA